MNQQQEVDIFAMSEDEFANWSSSLDSQSSEESAQEADSSTENSEELNDTTEQEEEYIDVPEEFEEEDEEEHQEESQEEEEQTSDEINYEAELKRLIGTPIAANGTEITLDSVEDAIKFIQMGANYYKKVQALAPAQKYISMLEQNDMLDADKLSFAIDLLNKNPQAINKLVSDLDLNEILDESNENYKPTDYSVDEANIAINDALKEISNTPTYARTVNVIGKEWDGKSRDLIKQHPEVIGFINSHMANGIYDAITREIEKRNMLGTIPRGLSNLEVYKLVGDDLYAKSATSPVQTDAQANANKAPAPIRKPSRETVIRQKKAATTPRGKATSVSKQMDDVFSMSSDAFNAKYGNYNL